MKLKRKTKIKLDKPEKIYCLSTIYENFYLENGVKVHNCSPNKSVVISADSDWIQAINPKVDFYRITKKKELHTFDSINLGMNAHEHISLKQSLFGSHNFLKSNVDKKFKNITTEEIKLMSDKDDYSFTTDKDLFLNQLKSFDIKSYPDFDKMNWMVNNLPLKAEFMDDSQFTQFCINNLININYSYYDKFKNSLKHDCT